MADVPRGFIDLPPDYIGDKRPWAELSDADLHAMVRANEWIGNLALLVALLERVAIKAAPTLYDWRALRAAMGDNGDNLGSTSLRQIADRWRAAHTKRGLWENHWIPDGPSDVADLYTFQPPKYGFESCVPLATWTGYYKTSYRVRMASRRILQVDPEELVAVGRRETAKFILYDVILRQRRYVSGAIADGYPSLFSRAAPKVQAIFDLQAAAGHKGDATGAKMALRSMLLLIGAEDPGRATLMLASIKRVLGYEVIGYHKEERLSFSMAVHEMAVTMAQRVPNDPEVQELAQRVSAFLFRPEGKMRAYDLELFERDKEDNFGYEGRQYEDEEGNPYPEQPSRRRRRARDKDSALEPGTKRHRAAVDSLVAFFGRPKVERMRLFVHTVHVQGCA